MNCGLGTREDCSKVHPVQLWAVHRGSFIHCVTGAGGICGRSTIDRQLAAAAAPFVPVAARSESTQVDSPFHQGRHKSRHHRQLMWPIVVA